VAVRLRLTRTGKKKQPTYRIVAADSRSPRDGRFLEIIGTYNPRTEPSALKVDNEAAVRWLRDGARPSEAVEKLLKISGAWAAFTGEAPPPAAEAAQTPPAAAAEAADGVAPVGSEESADSPDSPDSPDSVASPESADSADSVASAESADTPDSAGSPDQGDQAVADAATTAEERS